LEMADEEKIFNFTASLLEKANHGKEVDARLRREQRTYILSCLEEELSGSSSLNCYYLTAGLLDDITVAVSRYSQEDDGKSVTARFRSVLKEVIDEENAKGSFEISVMEIGDDSAKLRVALGEQAREALRMKEIEENAENAPTK